MERRSSVTTQILCRRQISITPRVKGDPSDRVTGGRDESAKASAPAKSASPTMSGFLRMLDKTQTRDKQRWLREATAPTTTRASLPHRQSAKIEKLTDTPCSRCTRSK